MSNQEQEEIHHLCKNCAAGIEGNYCHFCGQRYHDHKESFPELVYEFISDFVHFDSRFFKTVLPLLFAPGRLTIKYNAGMQRSQFHPIRLYIFSSFVYFFFFFAYNNFEKQFDESAPNAEIAINAMSDSTKTGQDNLPSADSSFVNIRKPDQPNLNRKQLVALNDKKTQYSISVTPTVDSLMRSKMTRQEYLSWQKKLPRSKRDNILVRAITAKTLEINAKGEYGKVEFFKKAIGGFLHNLPKMLFFLLPVFAFILKLLYIRHKEFYYVDHAILSLHFFSFIFLLLTLSFFILDKIFKTSVFGNIAIAWISLYLLIAMKKIYSQGWGKTIFKYMALGLVFFFTVLLVLIINVVFSTLNA